MFINLSSNTAKIPIKLFSPWKKIILNIVINLLNKSHIYPVTTVLTKEENLKYMHSLHSKFVIVPVDKASKNIGIICKKFYLETLFKEITESGNFEYSNLTINDITNNYIETLKNMGDEKPYDSNFIGYLNFTRFQQDLDL